MLAIRQEISTAESPSIAGRSDHHPPLLWWLSVLNGLTIGLGIFLEDGLADDLRRVYGILSILKVLNLGAKWVLDASVAVD